MKHVIIFPLLLFILGSVYLFVRGWQILPHNLLLRIVYTVLFLFLWSSYVIGMLGRNSLPIPLIQWLCFPGGTFMVVMMYLIFILLAVDLLRIANYFFHFFPAFITDNVVQAKYIATGVVALFLTIVLSIGYYRFCHPEVRTLEIDVDKPANGRKELHVVAISDVHLGFTITKDRLKQYVEKINALHPEVIVIAGDLIDVSTRPLEHYRMYEELQQLKAPLGVYMVTGNHEYISGIEQSLAFIEKTGIRLLQNEAVLVADSTFLVAGQADLSDPESKSMAYILKNAPEHLPVIGLSHQPYDVNLNGAVNSHVDLLLCGHTHEGQVWPGNLIVKKLFEVPYGYVRKENTHVYVSSGLGLWGPQFRIGTRSEIVSIRMKFK